MMSSLRYLQILDVESVPEPTFQIRHPRRKIQLTSIAIPKWKAIRKIFFMCLQRGASMGIFLRFVKIFAILGNFCGYKTITKYKRTNIYSHMWVRGDNSRLDGAYPILPQGHWAREDPHHVLSTRLCVCGHGKGQKTIRRIHQTYYEGTSRSGSKLLPLPIPPLPSPWSSRSGRKLRPLPIPVSLLLQ